MRSIGFVIGCALLASACVDDYDSRSQKDDVPSDEECECKIEGSAIGTVGVYVHIGDERYVFEEWIAKTGSPGEYVGFRLSANSGGASYVVKAGTARYEGGGTDWMHPNGNQSTSNAISNVDFCEDYPEGDDPEGDPPGDEEPPPGGDPEQGGDLPEVD